MSRERGNASLVVPLQDEEATVVALLESVARQARLPDEMVVVDAGSRDQTAKLVSQFNAPFPIKLVTAARLYPGEARNVGVAASGGEWIAFTDGGIRLEPDWLQRMMARADDSADVVCGSYAPVCDSLWTEASAIAYVAGRSRWGGRGPFVASLSIRRQAFLGLGGFPEYRAAEDLAFLERVAKSGLRVVYAPDAIAHWQLARTPAGTYRRFALYSHHNLAAGRGRFWHAGVARLYAALVVLVFLAWLHSVALASVIAAAFFLSRALKSAWERRGDLPFATLHPLRVVAAAVVLLVVDVATFAGVLRWLREPRPRRGD